MSVRLYTDIVFTDDQIEVIDSSVKKAGALETLARIEEAMSRVLQDEDFTLDHADFCNLLQRRSERVRDRFLGKTSCLDFFIRLFFGVSKQERAVEEASRRIIKLNAEKNSHAEHPDIALARSCKYGGKDLSEAQTYLRPLLASVETLVHDGFLYKTTYRVYHRYANLFRFLDAFATLRSLKQTPFSEEKQERLNNALLFYTHKKNIEAIKLLLLLGADPNVRKSQDELDVCTPLHVAAQLRHVEILTLLLEHRADVHAVDYRGNTPLCAAIVHAHGKPEKETLEIVQLLLQAGADPNMPAHNGSPPLHWVVERNHKEIAALLLKYGARINAYGMGGRTPLIFIIIKHGLTEKEKESMVSLLLTAGADPSKPGWEGYSPFHAAVARGYLEIITLLLDHGAYINDFTGDGDTALSLAAHQGQEEAVKLLFYHGADPTLLNHKGQNALELASTEGIRKFLSQAKLPDQSCPDPKLCPVSPPSI